MKKHTILAVDDEPSITRMLKLVLERSLPVEVFPFTDARDALVWLEHETAALIICDLRMPNMDGLTFCRALKERGLTIPILILSAYASTEMDREGQELGVKAIVQKPFIPRDFVTQIRETLPDPAGE